MNCDHCLIGRVGQTAAPFITSWRGKVLAVPNVPAIACDSCGELTYDIKFLSILSDLLNGQPSDVSFDQLLPRVPLAPEVRTVSTF